ncbi:MAG: GldG family protein [Candidatus Sericytochromatia bacterium]|nr:GldG family protein [Candidatus Tanganyikabacteria bacterium]
MSQNPQQPPVSGAAKLLDVAINLVGILAILLMLVAVLGSTPQAAALKIPASAVDPARNAGWVCIGLYILGSAWQSRDWLAKVWSRERTQSGTNLLVQVVLAVAIIGAVNYIGTRNHKRWDVTENKQFSLSEQTKKVIKELPGKIKVTMFVSPTDRSAQQNKDLWQEYAYVDSSKVEFKAIDADRNPGEVLKFVESLPKDQQSKVMEGGTIRLGTIALEHKGAVTSVTGYNEQDFTSALLKATRNVQKRLYWLEGHGEADPESFGPEGMGQLKQALEKQNYKIERLATLGLKAIPEDAAALVVAAPRKPLDEREVGLLTTYVKRGGKVLVTLHAGSGVGLEKWLADNYAVTPDKNVILEMDGAYTYNFNPLFPAVLKYPYHSITQSFQNNRLATVFPQARSFKIADQKPEGVNVEALAETSDRAQGRAFEKDLGAEVLQREFDEKRDLRGPLKVAVAITTTSKTMAPPDPAATDSATPKEKELKGRIVAIGSAFFASNQFAQRFANGDFFLAAMNWLAEEDALISIAPKNTESRTVELLGRTQAYLGLGTVAFPPIALLAIGLLVWWRRR